MKYFSSLDMWEEENGVEPGLPGHAFTSRQLFWIAAAQVQWFSFENQQSPDYVVNCHFSRDP